MTRPRPTFGAAPPEGDEDPPPSPAAPSFEADLALVLARPEGRRVVRHLLAEARVLGPSFDPDPAIMAFHEGIRAFGLRLVAVIGTAAPGALGAVLPVSNPED